MSRGIISQFLGGKKVAEGTPPHGKSDSIAQKAPFKPRKNRPGFKFPSVSFPRLKFPIPKLSFAPKKKDSKKQKPSIFHKKISGGKTSCAIAFNKDVASIVLMSMKGGNLRIESAQVIDLSSASASEIKAFYAVAKPAGNTAHLVLPPMSARMISAEKPDVPASELRDSLRWEIDSSVDDVTQYEIGVIDSVSEDGGNPVFVTIAPKAEVAEFAETVSRGGINVASATAAECAQMQIASMLQKDDLPVAILSFHKDGGLFTVSAKNHLYLARHIEISSTKLADEYSSQSAISEVAMDIYRSLEHIRRHFADFSIGTVHYIAPANVWLQQISEEVGAVMEPIEVSSIFELSAVENLSDFNFLADSFLAIGMAAAITCGTGTSFNWLEKEPVPRNASDWLCFKNLVVAGLAASASFGAVYGYELYQERALIKEAGEADRQFDDATAALQKLIAGASGRKTIDSLRADLKEAEKNRDARKKIVDALTNGVAANPTGYSSFIAAFTRCVPEGISLTGIEISGDGSVMTIIGTARNVTLITAFIDRLSKDPVFKGKQFQSFQADRGKETEEEVNPFVEFRLSASPIREERSQ